MSGRDVMAPLALALWRAALPFRPAPAGAVRILILHDVPPARQQALADLVAHMQRDCGVIGPAEAVARLEGRIPADGRAPCLLTFDDGFASNFEVAKQVLEPMGVRALFFVCPGLMDLGAEARATAIGQRIFRNRRPAGNLDLMGWDALGRLVAAGHEIGCHSARHAALAGLEPAELEDEVGGAGARMRGMLGCATPWFAFPFGDVGSIDAAALTAIGRYFPYCRSGVRGLAHAQSLRRALPAESVDLGGPAALRYLAAEGGMAPLYRRRLRRLEAMAAEAER